VSIVRLLVLCLFCVMLTVSAYGQSGTTPANDQNVKEDRFGNKPQAKPQTFEKKLMRKRAERLKENTLLLTSKDWKVREDWFASFAEDMDLREKVGQVFMLSFPGDTYVGETVDLIEKWKAGGVILYGICGNVNNSRQIKRLTDDMQARALPGGEHVPLFIAVDQEGGPVSRLREGFTFFPPAMAFGATGIPENAAFEARVMSTELLAVGINVDLAPVADINTNPDNPVIGLRSFGSDPNLVSAFVRAFTRTCRTQGLLAAAKHFPGHGEASVDSHIGLPKLTFDLQRLEASEFTPFKAAIQENVPMVMTAHVALPAFNPDDPNLPSTLSRPVLSLLRERLGFSGVIVTDSLFMGAIMERFGPEEAAVRAFEAGVDLLLFGADLWGKGRGGETVGLETRAMEALYQAVKSGRISKERLDASVDRVLRAKARIAPRLNIPSEDRYALLFAGDTSWAEAAERIAGDAVTLVRNAGFLPLAEEGGLAVIHPSDMPEVAQAFHDILPWARCIAVGLDPTAEDQARAATAAKKAGHALVIVRDVARHPGQEELVRALPKAGVVAAGLPYDLERFTGAPFLVAAYGRHPGAYERLAAVMGGERSFQGKLPVALRGLGDVGFSADSP